MTAQRHLKKLERATSREQHFSGYDDGESTSYYAKKKFFFICLRNIKVKLVCSYKYYTYIIVYLLNSLVMILLIIMVSKKSVKMPFYN